MRRWERSLLRLAAWLPVTQRLPTKFPRVPPERSFELKTSPSPPTCRSTPFASTKNAGSSPRPVEWGEWRGIPMST